MLIIRLLIKIIY